MIFSDIGTKLQTKVAFQQNCPKNLGTLEMCFYLDRLVRHPLKLVDPSVTKSVICKCENHETLL